MMFEKTMSNMHEVIAREGRTILITDGKGASLASPGGWATLVLPDMSALVAPFVLALPLQLLAYHTALVLGTDVDQPRNLAKSIYRPLSLNQAPLMFTARRTAELIKYATNAFLATKITFINEIADLSEKVGADVQEVARGIGLDNRIGSKFLHAGPGFGGSCFPKDTRALVKIALDHDVQLRIVEAVLGVNDNCKRAIARKVSNARCRRRRRRRGRGG